MDLFLLRVFIKRVAESGRDKLERILSKHRNIPGLYLCAFGTREHGPVR